MTLPRDVGAGRAAGDEIVKQALRLRATGGTAGGATSIGWLRRQGTYRGQVSGVDLAPKEWLLDVDEDYFFPDYSPAVVLARLGMELGADLDGRCVC